MEVDRGSDDAAELQQQQRQHSPRWLSAEPATVIKVEEEDDEQQEQQEANAGAAADDIFKQHSPRPSPTPPPPPRSYRDHPEWRGVRPAPPLPTDAEGGGKVAAIADRPGKEGRELKHMRALFRAAALGLGGGGEGDGGESDGSDGDNRPERSARVRELCGDLVQRLNPADYTAWAVRWECVLALAREQEGEAAAAVPPPPSPERALALLAEEDAFTRMVAREAGTKNYQLWNHRRKIALASFGLDPELPVVSEGGGGGGEGGGGLGGGSGNPPSSCPPEPALRAALARELSFADLALKGPEEDDAKNYHAWAHRQAALAACARQLQKRGGWRQQDLSSASAAAATTTTTANSTSASSSQVDAAAVWDPELRYCEARLREDVRNNSAWAQRMFVLLRGGALGGGQGGGGGLGGGAPAPRQLLPAAVVEREIHFVGDALLRAPRNESAWSYLWGLLGGDDMVGCAAGVPQAASGGASPAATSVTCCWPRKIHELCCAVLDDDPNCAPALDTLAGFYSALARAAAAAAAGSGGNEDASKAARQAVEDALVALRSAEVADPVRRGYWQWRAGELRAILEVQQGAVGGGVSGA
jgi:hypothetical protein